MDKIRRPFQGVWNIIRFNWHYYVLVLVVILVFISLRSSLNPQLILVADILTMLLIIPILISLVVSFIIYDISSLYKLTWLSNLRGNDGEQIINIHAGFEETSNLLKNKYPKSEMKVFDFYDPLAHTEVSISRARKVYPVFPGTEQITTNHVPLPDHSIDKVFIILSAHEIRNDKERIIFFNELRRVLAPTGYIIVTEHLRDIPNFLVYNIGFLHFLSKTTWLKTFQSAGLQVVNELKITPFITTFILNKNGNSS